METEHFLDSTKAKLGFYDRNMDWLSSIIQLSKENIHVNFHNQFSLTFIPINKIVLNIRLSGSGDIKAGILVHLHNKTFQNNPNKLMLLRPRTGQYNCSGM